ncbi:MAG: hypothetical protein IKK35_04480 [Rikenellaceae bacterium]|nr:hypothetical protein [Rikenellaceae bacterium]
MARIGKILLIVGVLVIFGACRELPSPFEYDRVVAQVGDKKLRESDVQSIYAQATTAEDSTALLEIYVDRWVKKELKLRAAENLFRDSEEAIEAMVAEYRNSLLTRRLDQHYVDQEIDTVFTDAQIEEYYNRHPSDFRLDRTVVRGRQVLVPTTFRQTTKLREAMRSSEEERLQDWRDMCQKSNLEVQEYTSWVDYTEFLSTLPTSRGRKYEELLKPNVLQEMRVDDGRYFFVITDIRRSGDAAPLERVRETIKRILFAQRQSEIIRAHEERIYNEALASGELRINLTDEEPIEEPIEEVAPADEATSSVQPTEKSEPTEGEPTAAVDTTKVVVADTTKQETKK